MPATPSDKHIAESVAEDLAPDGQPRRWMARSWAGAVCQNEVRF
jgi:hypothetical protein